MGRAGKGQGVNDDRVVSLKDRRSEPMAMGAVAPEWTTITPIEVQLEGRPESTPVHVRFGMIDHAPEGDSGYVSESEHGITASLYFERELFLAFQSAAVSSAPLTLFVTFAARDDSPPTLMLAIERRTA
jgi:hypothetical protein